MSVEDLGHMVLIERWLHGEVVHNTIGIRMRGGPFEGRFRIVELGDQRRPPARQRARGSRKRPPTDAWRVYLAIPAPDATAGWVYEYPGTEPYYPTRQISTPTETPSYLDVRGKRIPTGRDAYRATSSLGGASYCTLAVQREQDTKTQYEVVDAGGDRVFEPTYKTTADSMAARGEGRTLREVAKK